jgi:hypothetical protein
MLRIADRRSPWNPLLGYGRTHEYPYAGLSLDDIGAVRAPDRFCRGRNSDETERSRQRVAFALDRAYLRYCKSTAVLMRRCISRLGCRASSPCRRGSQRCRSRGIRSHRSGGRRGSGRCGAVLPGKEGSLRTETRSKGRERARSHRPDREPSVELRNRGTSSGASWRRKAARR